MLLAPHQMLSTGPVNPSFRGYWLTAALCSAVASSQKVTVAWSYVSRAHSHWLTDRKCNGLTLCLNSCSRVSRMFRQKRIIF